MNIYTS